MTTPPMYTQEMLSEVPGIDTSLFNFSNLERFRAYIQEGFLLSKGSLWGLGYTFPKRNSVKDDAKHGFIDYIFLTKTNYLSLGRKGFRCFYGEYGMEFSAQKALNKREFFNYPFNTGKDWDNRDPWEKFSDLTTLKNVLSPGQYGGEILVRRRIELDDTLIAFHCYNDKLEEIRSMIKDTPLRALKIVNHDKPNKINLAASFSCGLQITSEHLAIHDGHLFVQEPDREDVQCYRIGDDNKLYAPDRDEEVGLLECSGMGG
jgi:hypothetical protein